MILALAALLAFASSAGAEEFDKYGGATGLQCAPNRASITTPISKVARSGQTVTLTVADTSKLARYNAIVVSGTTVDRGSFNTPAGSLVYVTAKTADTIQYAQSGGSVASTADTGQVQLARFHVSKLGNRWWACTPLGNVFWISGVFSLSTDGGTDFQGVNNEAFIKAKYATGPAKSPTLNWLLSALRRMKDWGFTVMAEGAHVAAQPTTTNAQWGTPDQAPPIKMPYIVAPWPSHYAQFQIKGASTQPAKGYTNGVKRSLPNFHQHINLFRQVDPFDASFIGWLVGWMKESRPSSLASSVNNDYILAVAVDDGDSVAISRATPQFPTYSSGKPPDVPLPCPPPGGGNSALHNGLRGAGSRPGGVL